MKKECFFFLWRWDTFNTSQHDNAHKFQETHKKSLPSLREWMNECTVFTPHSSHPLLIQPAPSSWTTKQTHRQTLPGLVMQRTRSWTRVWWPNLDSPSLCCRKCLLLLKVLWYNHSITPFLDQMNVDTGLNFSLQSTAFLFYSIVSTWSSSLEFHGMSKHATHTQASYSPTNLALNAFSSTTFSYSVWSLILIQLDWNSKARMLGNK